VAATAPKVSRRLRPAKKRNGLLLIDSGELRMESTTLGRNGRHRPTLPNPHYRKRPTLHPLTDEERADLIAPTCPFGLRIWDGPAPDQPPRAGADPNRGHA